MLKINKDQKRMPFGGHHYHEDDFLIKGDTLGEVSRKLGEYRANNNRPVRDPTQDILRYYLVNFPWMVKVDDEESPEETDQFVNWRSWVQRTWEKPPKKSLTKKEASIRWEVCKSCPHNQPIEPGLSQPEFEQITRKAFLLRRGVKIPQELGFCCLHRFDIGVAVFLETPRDFSEKPKDDPDYPSCWV